MKILIRQSLGGAFVFGMAFLVAGCSSFNREWKSAARPTDGSLAGRWEGRWLSDKNGHTGKLLCLLTRESDTNYHAHFKATYWKIVRSSYRVELVGELREGVWQFQGEQDLGWLAGGTYHYAGRVTPTNFFSTYDCRYDHGTFEMKPVP